jgi:hypothetical protein
MTRARVSRCGRALDEARVARVELEALGVDVAEQHDDFAIGYRRALRDAEHAERLDLH